MNQAIALEPRNRGAYIRLAQVYREMGRHADGLALLERAQALSGAQAAFIYARMGKHAEARRILKSLSPPLPGRPMPINEMAGAYAALGEKDKAFEMLFRNLETRNT